MSTISTTRAIFHHLRKLSVSSISRRWTPGVCNFREFSEILSARSQLQVHVSCRSLTSGVPYTTSRVTFSEDAFSESEGEQNEEQLMELRQKHRKVASNQHTVQDGIRFADFPINKQLLQRLDSLGYSEPFEIQAKTLPLTLSGRDVIGRALTGSGKTLAFSVPIVQKISQSERQRQSRGPKAIVISPTRELCLQIYRSIQELDPKVRCVPIYGGAGYTPQEAALSRGVDVVCATPGRLNDHLQRGNLSLDALEFLCLDEADELLNPNFKMQLENVLDNSPKEKQVMLFSATMPPDIVHLTRKYLHNPAFVDIASSQKHMAPESVKHVAIKCPPSTNYSVIKALFEEHKPERCIVFMETKVKTTHAAAALRRLNLKADALNSDLSQRQRGQILGAFRLGTLNTLVATDVAARGLDIPEVDLVIQVGPPRNGVDYYIHRSGRTGRAGREGLSVLLHCGVTEDVFIIRQIEKMVSLQHIPPPNQEKLMESMLQNVLKSIESIGEMDKEKYLPMVENLEITNLEESKELLASAIAQIMKLKIGNVGEYSTSHNRDEPYGQGQSYQFNRRHNRNQGQNFQDNRSHRNRYENYSSAGKKYGDRRWSTYNRGLIDEE